MKLGVIDYGGGNLRSLLRAFQYLGAEPKTVSGPDDFEGLTHLAFPGQGAFGDSMEKMKSRDLVDPIATWLKKDNPFFGICIGYQLLFEGSEESPETPGFGILPGQVKRFSPESGLKVPHMGWNQATPRQASDSIWSGLEETPYFYFVHSYFPHPTDQSLIASSTEYGETFASSVKRGNLFATQFHPEKSQHTGLQLLKNFLKA